MTPLEFKKPAESAGSSLFQPSFRAWLRDIKSSAAGTQRRTPCTHELFPPSIRTAGLRVTLHCLRFFLVFPSPRTVRLTVSCSLCNFLVNSKWPWSAELYFPLNTNWREGIKPLNPGQLFLKNSFSNLDWRIFHCREILICVNSEKSSFFYLDELCVLLLPGLAECIMLSIHFPVFLSRSSVLFVLCSSPLRS